MAPRTLRKTEPLGALNPKHSRVPWDPSPDYSDEQGNSRLRNQARYQAQLLGAIYIRHARKQRHWSQRDLAHYLRVTPGYIAQLESVKAEDGSDPEKISKVPLDFLVQVHIVTGVPFFVGDPSDLGPQELVVPSP